MSGWANEWVDGRVSRFLTLLIVCLALMASAPGLAAEKDADTPFCRIFDGAVLVPENNLTHQFIGNPLLMNDKLLVLIGKRSGHMNAWAKTSGDPEFGAHVGTDALIRGSVREPNVSLRLIENGPGAAMMRLALKTDPKVAISFRLTAGEPVVEIRPAEGTDRVHVSTNATYAVVPEFFADDMVFDISVPGSKVPLPVESLCLYPVDGGDAIVMCVFRAAPRRAVATGKGPTWFSLAGGKSFWLAILEGKGIWHCRAAGAKDNWKPPFAAKWRCSVAGKDGLAVSYDYDKGPPAGVALGDGPTIIYPIDRTKATPLTAILPVDVMRNTLGVGPCEYVLQAEGLASEANPTPQQVTRWVERQFKRKKEKAARDEIRERLELMVEHVARVQARIGQYGDAAKRLRALCQQHAGDEGAARSLAIVDQLEQTAGADGDAPRAAKQLADAVVALIGKEDALAECQRLGEQIRAIGSAQDAALARCRLHLRRLRAECASRPASALSKGLEPRVGRILQAK